MYLVASIRNKRRGRIRQKKDKKRKGRKGEKKGYKKETRMVGERPGREIRIMKKPTIFKYMKTLIILRVLKKLLQKYYRRKHDDMTLWILFSILDFTYQLANS